MALNKIQIDAIASRSEHGNATNQDCRNLLEHFSQPFTSDFMVEVHRAIEGAIENSISAGMIANAVERAVMAIKN